MHALSQQQAELLVMVAGIEYFVDPSLKKTDSPTDVIDAIHRRKMMMC